MPLDFWKLPRVPEPEEMDDVSEVSSYSDAAAEQHLARIDDSFVSHAVRLAEWYSAATNKKEIWIDIGSGPAQIPIKLLKQFPELRIVAIDRSRNMLLRARQDALRAGVAQRLLLVVSDGHQTPFSSGYFHFAMCNSVLHHARSPVALLCEMARVALPDVPMLLRDLRRPNRLLLPWHLWCQGRKYRGLMRKLFNDSVCAAYTVLELQEFVELSKIQGVVVFKAERAHIGIERNLRTPAS